MAAFILVHGTFARQAVWTRPDSPLSLELVSAAGRHGEPARLHPVAWGGKNRERDRVRAAATIADQVRSCQAAYPGEPIFLVGHSHGGSSIAYFLKVEPTLREGVAGSAFLSTPFVALRLRPLWEAWFLAFMVSAGNAATFAVGLLAFHLGSYVSDNRLDLLLALALALVVAGTITMLIAVRIFGSRVKNLLHTTLLHRIAASETADLPTGHYLFLRATGDEAATVLGAGQFMSWLMARLSERFNGLILRARKALTTRNRYGSHLLSFLQILLLVVMSILYFVFSFLIIMAISMLGSWMPNDPATLINPVSLIEEAIKNPMDAPIIAVWVVLLMIFFGVAAYSLTIMTALFLSAFALRLLGWTSLLEAVFADFAVEPMPYGQFTFSHIGWKADGIEASGLNHSVTYLNPAALRCLGDWVDQRLTDRPAKVAARSTAVAG